MKTEFNYDVEAVRAQFPACKLEIGGAPIAYLDGAAGTQVPYGVLDAVKNYMVCSNANEDGNFPAGQNTSMVEKNARAAVADFIGCEECEVGFNCSSTQNNFNLALNLSKKLKPGDEIIVTQIDHRCNIEPWKSLERFGCVVKMVRLDTVTSQLDFEDYKSKLSAKTKIVAVNWAANLLGTITDVKKYVDLAHQYGAFTVVDAVHYAAHRPIDVKSIGTDVLLFSAYKCLGPHVGVIYMRKDRIAELDFTNLKCEDILYGARKFHMGTPQFELISGVTAAINFISSIGEKYADCCCFANALEGLSGRRRNVVAGMLAIDKYEQPLAQKLRFGLRAIPGVKVYGPAEGAKRTPTIVFTMDGHSPEEISKILGKKGINSWNGDCYAVETIDALGLKETGGLLRLSVAPYSTQSDIDRALNTVRELALN